MRLLSRLELKKQILHSQGLTNQGGIKVGVELMIDKTRTSIFLNNFYMFNLIINYHFKTQQNPHIGINLTHNLTYNLTQFPNTKTYIPNNDLIYIKISIDLRKTIVSKKKKLIYKIIEPAIISIIVLKFALNLEYF